MSRFQRRCVAALVDMLSTSAPLRTLVSQQVVDRMRLAHRPDQPPVLDTSMLVALVLDAIVDVLSTDMEAR